MARGWRRVIDRQLAPGGTGLVVNDVDMFLFSGVPGLAVVAAGLTFQVDDGAEQQIALAPGIPVPVLAAKRQLRILSFQGTDVGGVVRSSALFARTTV